MSWIPSSTVEPSSFISPGLRKALVRLGLASEKDLEKVQRISSNLKAISLLANQGVFEEAEALKKIAEHLGCPLIEGGQLTERLDSDTDSGFGSVDYDFALRRRCFPFRKQKNETWVAMADPLDVDSITELEFLLQTGIKVFLALEADIVRVIGGFISSGSSHDGSNEMEVVTNVNNPAGKVTTQLTAEQVEESSKAAPVVALVNKILADAISVGASDIHIEPSARKVELRLRIDGVMSAPLNIPDHLQPYVITRIKILAGMDITEKRRPQDGSFRLNVGKRSFRDVRVSSIPTPFGEKIVLRILRSELEGILLKDLNMPEEVEKLFLAAIHTPNRAILVTGPTGSGKTTTLYAAVELLKDGTNNIITIEDPIELRIARITQIQVDKKIGMTFASVLRSCLRQDPDVILVGEIRDLETAEIAFQAAQTGHLVLSTLHTNSAASAVVRLLDLGLPPYIIASSLGGILSQRLVRKLCTHCAMPVSAERAKEIAEVTGCKNREVLKAARGCDQCGKTGYHGRVGLYTFLPVDNRIRELIRNSASEEELARVAGGGALGSLVQHGFQLINKGVTSIEEIERVVGLDPEGGERNAGDVIDAGLTPESELALSYIKGLSSENVSASPELVVSKSTNGANTHVSGAHDSVASLAANYQAKDYKRIIPKLLLIDDDEGIRAVMGQIFKQADFEVLEALDGQDALRLVDDFRPDIVLCDLMMPGMDGKEVLRRMRENHLTRDIPFVILTAASSSEREIALIEMGASDFISKTSSPGVVISRVKRLLHK